MPYKKVYDKLKAERPEEWRRRMAVETTRQTAKRDALFLFRFPERARQQKCRKCGTKFFPRRRGGALQVFCSKRCQISDMNLKRRQRYPGRAKAALQALQVRRQTRWQTYMEGQRCSMCGENHPATLEHHHRDPKSKSFNVGTAWGHYPWQVVLLEIEKCIVLCANCHRKLEWSLRQAQKNETA